MKFRSLGSEWGRNYKLLYWSMRSLPRSFPTVRLRAREYQHLPGDMFIYYNDQRSISLIIDDNYCLIRD